MTVTLSEVREGEISYDILYMWNLKRNDANELTKQKETYRLRESVYGCQGEGKVRECGMDMHTLLYLNADSQLARTVLLSGLEGGLEKKG